MKAIRAVSAQGILQIFLNDCCRVCGLCQAFCPQCAWHFLQELNETVLTKAGGRQMEMTA